VTLRFSGAVQIGEKRAVMAAHRAQVFARDETGR
jgi:hypothetical protein